MRKILWLFAVLSLSLGFVSCNDDNDCDSQLATGVQGVYDVIVDVSQHVEGNLHTFIDRTKAKLVVTKTGDNTVSFDLNDTEVVFDFEDLGKIQVPVTLSEVRLAAGKNGHVKTRSLQQEEVSLGDNGLIQMNVTKRIEDGSYIVDSEIVVSIEVSIPVSGSAYKPFTVHIYNKVFPLPVQ